MKRDNFCSRTNYAKQKRYMKSASRSFFVFLFFSLNIFSQIEPTIKENITLSSLNLHQWGTISSFNGLPSERVNSITQTADGFLWFATDNGLAKFDGRRVQTNLSLGLSTLRIFTLQTDAEDTLWIGTEKGAFFHKNNSFKPVQETADYAINSIFIDDETVYLTNSTGFVFQTTKQKDSIETKILLKSSLPIRSISKVKDEIYIGTFDRGLLKVNNSQAEQIETNPRPFFINALAKNAEGKLWFGAKSQKASSGLFIADKLPNLKVVGKDLGTINSINFGEGNETWIGTDKRGAFLFENKEFRKRFTFENTSGGLRSNKILDTYVDREGVIWFGTDKGISRFDPESPRNQQISEDVQSNYVRTLFVAENGKAFAGTNRGLYEFNEKSNIWQKVLGLERRSIYAISESVNNTLLVGSPGGLSLFGNRDSTKLVADESIRSIVKFRDGTYYSSFGEGLKQLGVDDPDIAPLSNIISLYNEEDNYLWIGTINKGVFTFDGEKVVPKPELEELTATTIRAISGNEQDGIWFATDRGLYLFKNRELQVILANQNARDVFTSRKNVDEELRVWCATENGIFILKFSENFGWISSRIDIEQGLASQNSFAVLQLKGNSILIGTNRGTVRYTTNEIRPLLVPNRILSKRVHQSSELQTGINLNYPQNSLSLDVSAISSRTFTEQFLYSFLLFNSKSELIEKKFSEDSEFLMDNLEPDTYRVEVRAFDKTLLASEPLSFNLTVEKAPFPIVAAFLGFLLLIALAALAWAVFSQRKIYETSTELVYANKELNNARLNLANEAERERHRISRDLHDQTLADLRHLILMTDEVPSENANEIRTEIESVSDEIRRICEDLSPSVLENIGFAAALVWSLGNSVEQVSKENKITHEFIADEDLEEKANLTRSEQIQIYRIAQEVLSNIVRHSEATEIKMTAKTSVENVFVLKIEDNGKTFSPEKSKKGRGLANINARAKLIKAKVYWTDAVETGMIFTLTK